MTPRKRDTGLKPWIVVIIALLDDVVIIGLVFLVLWGLNIEISVAGIIAIGLVLGTFAFIVHRAVVPSLRRRKVTGVEGMIGQTAVVTEFLQPTGTVLIHGEYWNATCVEGDIEEGAEVEIVEVERLKLEVRRKP